MNATKKIFETNFFGNFRNKQLEFLALYINFYQNGQN